MSGAFERLSPALQYQIVNILGFSALRPVQELSIPVIRSGRNAILLAPTAGGKTEATFFPLLSAMDEAGWSPTSVLYLSPIKALLNNQEARLSRYAELLGRRAFKWHGDTKTSERKKFIKDPADILLTTPESLEAMLMSGRVPSRLFAHIEAVVIDEIHAFADDDRGAHLVAVLERLRRFARRDFQRIGLSATVGNPDAILRWMKGSSQRAGAVVRPPPEARAPELGLDFVGDLDGAAHVISKLHRGEKRLVFVDSRRKVESLGRKLRERQIDTYLIHGSLSVEERQLSERMFTEGNNCVIVSTSAMELGIDIGDLDRVIQIDSPGTVSSFLQRMGRTGRRAGQVSNCTFLCTDGGGLLEAAAIVRLFREGFVEAVRPSSRASHILAHQVMALCIQQAGLPRSDVLAWVSGTSSFADLLDEDIDDILDHMLGEDILAETGGVLWLGPKGEKLFGRRNFSELYAVFSTPRLVVVAWGGKEVGTVDAQFLANLQEKNERSTFMLAGRPWFIESVDWRRGRCAVRPAENAAAARWSGAPSFLSFEVCQAIRRVLVGEEFDPSWSRRATETLTELRDEHAFLRDEATPLTDAGPDKIRWWTFAGGRANSLLARLIEAELGGRCIVRNTSIDLSGRAGQSIAGAKGLLRTLAASGRPNRDDAGRFAEGAIRHRLSKFEPCLPPRLLCQLWAEAGLDLEGATSAVTTTAALTEALPPPPATQEALVGSAWVSASRVRNALLQDWILDWLDLHGENNGFRPDTKAPWHDPRTDFTSFVFERAHAFEAAVLAHLGTLTRVETIATRREEIRSPAAVERTLAAMRRGVPVIYQGVLHDEESQTYGAPDFLVRSDELRRLFVDALEDFEAVHPAQTLGQPFHYRVVDAKFTTLSLQQRTGELGNAGSCLAYKAQLFIYGRALGALQGYLPPRAYLLGRSWQQGEARGTSAFERLAPMSHTREIKKGMYLGAVVNEAVEWVRRVRSEGSRWTLRPKPSVPELWPNMSHTQDAPWRSAKKRIARDLDELTLLWHVGHDKRAAAHAEGVFCWSDPRCTAETLGVVGEKTGPTLDAILAANRDAAGPVLRPERVTADEAVWRPVPALEFFVDFETVSDLDDDFSTFPERGGHTLIAMIGCGHVEDGAWRFCAFTVDALAEASEAAVIEAWLEHMEAVRQRLAPEIEKPRVFHWSSAEVSFLDSAFNSARARHPGRAWPEVNWYDLLQRVIRAEPVVVRGALGFGLKPIAQALHRHGLIETSWGSGPGDGLGAMVGLWRAQEEARVQNLPLRELDHVSAIERYNESDCRAMAEILHLLRSKA